MQLKLIRKLSLFTKRIYKRIPLIDMETTPKSITVVYRVALFSLVVMAAFVLLLFGHRGHNAAGTAASDASPYRFAKSYAMSNRQFTRGGVIGNTARFLPVTLRGVTPPPVGSWSIWEGGTQVVPNTSFGSLPVTANGVTLSSLSSMGGVYVTLKFAFASVPAYIGAQVVINFSAYGVLSTRVDILAGFASTASGTLTGTPAVRHAAGEAATGAHLAWTTTDATYAWIDHGVGALTVKPSGTTRGTVTVLLTADTVYTLIAMDRGGNLMTYPWAIHVHACQPAPCITSDPKALRKL